MDGWRVGRKLEVLTESHDGFKWGACALRTAAKSIMCLHIKQLMHAIFCMHAIRSTAAWFYSPQKQQGSRVWQQGSSDLVEMTHQMVDAMMEAMPTGTQ